MSARPGPVSRTWRGHAFGLELESSVPLPGIPQLSSHRYRRSATIELVSPDAIDRAWRFAHPQPVLERRFNDGSPMLMIHHDTELGYRIWAPRHGRHLVSTDGSVIRSALPRVAAWRWQRLLFAQVLPLAATLRGVHFLHASSVALRGGALLFIAPSGTGKSSLAAHLVARGAALVTDDAIALELQGPRVVVHPGAGLASLGRNEFHAMAPEGQARLGQILGESDKMLLATELVDHSLPLEAIYFLARGAAFEQLRISGAEANAPRLLGSCFFSYLKMPSYLLEHLDLCRRIAETIPTFDVAVPAGVPASRVAAAVEAHALRPEQGRAA